MPVWCEFLCNLLPSIIYSVPCDPIMQSAYYVVILDKLTKLLLIITYYFVLSQFQTVRIFYLSFNQFLAGSCDVNPSYRYECGWLGIDKETCLKRDCCWDDRDPNAKFCFVRKYKSTEIFFYIYIRNLTPLNCGITHPEHHFFKTEFGLH